MITLVLKGCRTIVDPVSLITCIRDCTGSTLIDAKRSFESFLGGNEVPLILSEQCDAVSVLQQLQGFGVIVEQVTDTGTAGIA